MPQGQEQQPVPAIVEFKPYRKRDCTAYADSLTHPYFAHHGFASIRIDMRGTGDSEGTQRDYMEPGEVTDGVEAITWIARQPWCTGAIGLIGLSWGGMQALRVAARAPTELKCIITTCSTDDRYGNDVHYNGGCLLTESATWSAVLQNYFSRPPDPANVGESWRKMWLERLDCEEPPIKRWLEHQRADDYWTKEVLFFGDYERIKCPVYAVGGWFDGYSDTVLRLMERLKCPRRALIGPWQHIYPHFGMPGPGPSIGFLQDALRWFGQWLKGVDTGILEEPMIRAWMFDTVPATPYFQTAPGRWVCEPSWPSGRTEISKLHLTPNGTLERSPYSGAALSIKSPYDCGIGGGLWLPERVSADLAGDQREDDGKSLVFDTAPLSERVEILGAPVVRLRLAGDKPYGTIAVRLCDVDPAGCSRRVSYRLLNLAHRSGSQAPLPMQPCEAFDVEIRLKDIAYGFAPGHRVRLAISTSYWPMAWPSKDDTTVTVHTAESSLDLPLRPPNLRDRELPEFGEPESAEPLKVTVLRPSSYPVARTQDLASGRQVIEMVRDDGHYRIDEIDLSYQHKGVEVFEIKPDDPCSARLKIHWEISFARGDWQTSFRHQMRLSCDRQSFYLEDELQAHERGNRVFERVWSYAIPRDNV
jgi:putative CocE/NonD family hydrolase